MKARAQQGGGKTAAAAVLTPGLQDSLVGVHVRPGLPAVEVERIQPQLARGGVARRREARRRRAGGGVRTGGGERRRLGQEVPGVAAFAEAGVQGGVAVAGVQAVNAVAGVESAA